MLNQLLRALKKCVWIIRPLARLHLVLDRNRAYLRRQDGNPAPVIGSQIRFKVGKFYANDLNLKNRDEALVADHHERDDQQSVQIQHDGALQDHQRTQLARLLLRHAGRKDEIDSQNISKISRSKILIMQIH